MISLSIWFKMAEKRRGRAPKVPLNEQLDKYRMEKLSLLTDDRTIKPYNDIVFETIGNELGMTPKAVHWSVTRNINEIFDTDEAEEINAKIKLQTTEIKHTHQENQIDYLFHKIDGTVNVIINVSDPKELYYFDFVQNEGPNRAWTSLRPG